MKTRQVRLAGLVLKGVSELTTMFKLSWNPADLIDHCLRRVETHSADAGPR